jgi:Xaa-Pro aminopeptidase
MFDPAIYRERRNRLKKDVGSGLILLLGNDEVGMNYAANTYHFRQDSTFLYFFAVDQPGLAALDTTTGTETLCDDLTVADIVWTGPQPTHRGPAESGGLVARSHPAECRLGAKPAGRRGHFLASRFRTEHTAEDHGAAGLETPMVAACDRSRCTRRSWPTADIKTPEELRRSNRVGVRARCTCRDGAGQAREVSTSRRGDHPGRSRAAATCRSRSSARCTARRSTTTITATW